MGDDSAFDPSDPEMVPKLNQILDRLIERARGRGLDDGDRTLMQKITDFLGDHETNGEVEDPKFLEHFLPGGVQYEEYHKREGWKKIFGRK